MKTISLSVPAVRISCIIGDFFLAGVAGVWLWYTFSWIALLSIALGALLLGFYNILVFRSAILVDQAGKKITLRGLQERTDDVSAAVCVYTEERKVDSHTTRVIQVADEDGKVLSSISTLNSIRQGFAVEVTAQALAKALGVEFRATIPAHLYDKEAHRKYQQEQRDKACQKRRERKNRRSMRDTPPAADPVNYDEMDDAGRI